MNPVLKNIHVQIHTRDAIHCVTENLNLPVHESSLRMIEDFVFSLKLAPYLMLRGKKSTFLYYVLGMLS